MAQHYKTQACFQSYNGPGDCFPSYTVALAHAIMLAVHTLTIIVKNLEFLKYKISRYRQADIHIMRRQTYCVGHH